MDHPGRTVVVVTGGETPIKPADLPHNAWVIGVDSGVGHALRLGLEVREAVGDFDSIAPAHLEQVERNGAYIERHNVEKNSTDLELGLDAAARREPHTIYILGGYGGRFDHLLANVLAISHPKFARFRVIARMGEATLTVVRRVAKISGTEGELLTLLPVHGPACRVYTTGLQYPLKHEDLAAGSSRGVSNVMTHPMATVQLESGTLVAVQPGQK